MKEKEAFKMSAGFFIRATEKMELTLKQVRSGNLKADVGQGSLCFSGGR